MYVSSNYFSTLGVDAAARPGFTQVDDATRAEAEAVIGHRVWQARFNGDPAIIGRTIDHQPDRLRRRRRSAGGVPRPRRRSERLLLSALAAALAPSASDRAPEALASTRDASVGPHRRAAVGGHDGAAGGRDRAVRGGGARRAVSIEQLRTRPAASSRTFRPARGCERRSSFARSCMAFGLSGIVLLVVGLNISGHDAGPQRDAAARTGREAGDGREPPPSRAISPERGAGAGDARRQPCVCACCSAGRSSSPGRSDMWGPALDLFKPDPWLVAAMHRVVLASPASSWACCPRFASAGRRSSRALKNDSAGGGQRVGRLQRFTAAAQAGLAVPFLVICGVYLDQARATAFADVGFTPQGLYAARLDLSAIARTDDEQRLFVRTVQENLAQAPGVTSVQRRRWRAARLHLSQRAGRAVRRARTARRSFVTAHTTRVESGLSRRRSARACSLAARSMRSIARAPSGWCCCPTPLARQLFPAGDPLGARVDVRARPVASSRPTRSSAVTADLVSTQMGNPRPQLFLSLAQHPASTVAGHRARRAVRSVDPRRVRQRHRRRAAHAVGSDRTPMPSSGS